MELARKLNCFPPVLIAKPFNHLSECLDMVAIYPMGKEGQGIDYSQRTRDIISQAKNDYEENNLKEIENLMMSGEYDKAIELAIETDTPESKYLLSQAYFAKGLTFFLKEEEPHSVKNKLEYYNQSCIFLEQAVNVFPDDYMAHFYWGVALSGQGKLLSGDSSKDMHQQAIVKYEEALKFKPDMHDALYNWGVELSALAELTSGEEGKKLLEQALEKYKEAVNVGPDKYKTLNNWGATLILLYRLVPKETRIKILNEADTVLKRGEGIQQGSCALNLACIAAIRDQKDKCKEWLSIGFEHGKTPLRKELEKDIDFENVRNEPWFQEFLDAAEPESE